MQPVQVFQQPDTGTAMDGRHVKSDFTYSSIREFQYIALDNLIIEIGKSIADLRVVKPYPRMLLEIIVLAGIALAQDLIYGLTTMTAKVLILKPHRSFTAIFTTMVTGISHCRFSYSSSFLLPSAVEGLSFL
jgi:hypothetical protein